MSRATPAQGIATPATSSRAARLCVVSVPIRFQAVSIGLLLAGSGAAPADS
jgi:hypothetical protein